MSWWSRPRRTRHASPGEPAARQSRATAMGVTLGLTACAIGLLLAAPRVIHRSPGYEIGQFTDRSVRAPFDFSVADEIATAEKREEARRTTPPVAAIDREAGPRIAARISLSFATAREAIEAAPGEATNQRGRGDVRGPEPIDLGVDIRLQVAAVEDRIGLELREEERRALAADRFSEGLERHLIDLVQIGYQRPIADDLVTLRRLATEPAGGAAVRLVIRDTNGREQMLTDLSGVDDLASARRRVLRAPADPTVTFVEAHAPWASLVSRLLVPNLTYDARATEARREAAASAVLPVMIGFRRNQLIIGEGQEVTREARLVLDALRERDRPGAVFPRWLAATALGLLLLLVAVRPTRRMPAGRRPEAQRNSIFSAAGVLVTALGFWLWLLVVDAIWAQWPAMPRLALTLFFPLQASAMLVSLVGNRRDGLSHLLVTSIVAGLLSEFGAILALQSIVGGLVGINRVAGCSRRGCVVRAGLAVGAVGMVSAAATLTLSDLPVTGTILVSSLAAALVGGTASGLAVVALSSVVESLFGYTTNIRLVELLSYEHPLLRRLAAEAPGTFQHCISAAVLGSAAAEAIGARGLLVRVGTLYHDVGKLERPAFFTENQRGTNPHDQLPPEESARLIRAHVPDGLALIRQHGISDQIADFVREHHGTNLMASFAARAEDQGLPIDSAVFRYPGPRPRSKETAILMIADQVEATARSMADANESAYRQMVDRTIERIRTEGQMDDAPLTLGDLHRIQDALVTALVDSNHRRVAYPK